MRGGAPGQRQDNAAHSLTWPIPTDYTAGRQCQSGPVPRHLAHCATYSAITTRAGCGGGDVHFFTLTNWIIFFYRTFYDARENLLHHEDWIKNKRVKDSLVLLRNWSLFILQFFLHI